MAGVLPREERAPSIKSDGGRFVGVGGVLITGATSNLGRAPEHKRESYLDAMLGI